MLYDSNASLTPVCQKGKIFLSIFYFRKYSLLILCEYSDCRYRCSGLVVGSSTAYTLIIFRPRLLNNALDYSNFAYIYKMECNSANNKQKYAKYLIPSLIRILHYVMPLNHN